MTTGRHLRKIRTYLRMAQELATLSTCRRLHVGAILLRENGSIGGVGYNGALPGAPHCNTETCNPSVRCLNTRHAERSALDYSEGPVRVACGTHEPCRRCTLDLIARGVRAIYWVHPYRSEGDDERAAKRRALDSHSVLFEQVDPTEDPDAELAAEEP